MNAVEDLAARINAAMERHARGHASSNSPHSFYCGPQCVSEHLAMVVERETKGWRPPVEGRPDWDEYFLTIAEDVALRGECQRSKAGAVIVKDQRILATGYNGVAAGQPSCLDGVCPRERNAVPRGTPYDVGTPGECIALHAEDNAVEDAKRRGVAVLNATLYLNKEPCERCWGLLDRCQFRVVWRDRTKGTSGEANWSFFRPYPPVESPA